MLGLPQFKITLKGKTADQLKRHLPAYLHDDLVLPDEPALVTGFIKTVEVLGTKTPQHAAGLAAASVRAAGALQAARAETELRLAAAAKKKKAPKARSDLRQRNREHPTRLPCPSIGGGLVGKAVVYGFAFDGGIVAVNTKSKDELVGRSMRKNFDGQWFRGKAADVDGELELIQSHMAQKPVLRGEVGCACVAREVSVERGGMGERGCARRLGGWVWV